MNFLNSYAFEQMAREYYAKYGKTYALNKKDDKIILKVKNDFEIIYRLFCMLKNTFKYKQSLTNVFKSIEGWIQDACKLINDDVLRIHTNKQIKHKECAVIFIDLLNSFVDYINNIEETKQLENGRLEVGFCEKVRVLYIKFFEIIKNFYINL